MLVIISLIGIHLVSQFKIANIQAIFVSQIWRKISTDKFMHEYTRVENWTKRRSKKRNFPNDSSRQVGARIRTANKISHSAEMDNHRAALEEDHDSRAESAVLTSTIKSLVSVLSSDVKAFQFQSATSATH